MGQEGKVKAAHGENRREPQCRARVGLALPPSSSTTGSRYSAQVIAMILPTRVEPVNLTRRTAGCAKPLDSEQSSGELRKTG
jgi:hypothetical protein